MINYECDIQDNTGPLGPWMPERSEKIKISSKKAQMILDNHNTHNRNPVGTSIQIIEKALVEGKWEVNGETIIFSREGVLLDGQNRLYACANTGIPLTSWVVFGMKPDAFKTIDRGRNRNLASDLSIMGEYNVNSLAAVLQMVCAYYDGIRSSTIIRSKYDTDIALQVLKQHPKLTDSVSYIRSRKYVLGCPERILTLVHYVTGNTDNIKVIMKRDEFFERLHDGIGLSEANPILILRNKFYSMMSNPDVRMKKGMGHHSTFAYLHYVIKAWNLFMMGHTVSKFQLSYSDESRTTLDSIPDIRNYFRKQNENTTV